MASADARISPGCSCSSVPRSENGRRICETSIAEMTNEAESPMYPAPRPNAATTSPPTAAPTASMVPHVAPARMLAVARSSRSTRLGTAAIEAGSNTAPSAAMAPARTYTSHTCDGRWITKNPSAKAARSTSARIISACRLSRSASGPPKKMNKVKGTVMAAYKAATRPGECVSEKTSPARATNRNQSPVNDTTCARKRRRKCGFRRRRRRVAPRALRFGETSPVSFLISSGSTRPRLSGSSP